MRWIKHAWFNVLRNSRRSFLTVVVTAIATTALLLTGGFGLFTYESLEEMAARENGNVILSAPEYFTEEEDYPLQYGISGYEDISEYYNGQDDVKAVLPRIDFSGLASNGDKSTIFVGMGVSAQEFQVKGPSLLMIDGKTLSSYTQEDTDPKIMLAKGLSRNLKMEVGDYVTLMATTTDGALNAIDFEVSGIFTTGVPELDKRLVYTDLTTTQSLLDSNLISTLAIYLFDHSKTDTYMRDVSERQDRFSATPWTDRAFYYEKVKNLYNNIFLILGGIIAAMVFISISNTMNMCVVERTREIGTLAALGTYRNEIIRNFLLEGAILGVLGTLLGILTSGVITVFLLVVEITMPPPPGSSMDYPLYVNFSIPMAVITFFALTAICTLAAWSAAAKSTKKPIVEALTHV